VAEDRQTPAFAGDADVSCRAPSVQGNAAGRRTFRHSPPLLRLHECTSGTNPGTSGRLERKRPRKHGALASSGTGDSNPNLSPTRYPPTSTAQLGLPGQHVDTVRQGTI